MRVPDRVYQIAIAFYYLHPDLAHGTDDQRRELTRLIAEQVRFELGEWWGRKQADWTRPVSKDAIAFREVLGRMFSWDWQNGDTRAPNPPGEMEDVTGQVFVPVDPIDHLSATPGPSSPIPPMPIPTPDPSSDLLVRLVALEQSHVELGVKVESIRQQLEQFHETDKTLGVLITRLGKPLEVRVGRALLHSHSASVKIL